MMTRGFTYISIKTNLAAAFFYSHASMALSYDSVCGNVNTASSGNTGAATQALQYCQAAKSSQSAANADGILWKVWAGVAGVCAAACVSSLAGHPWNQWVCAGTDIAGAATDGIITKQFATALMSVGTAVGGVVINQITNEGKEAGKKKDIGSCLSAAMAGYQVYAKYTDEKSQNTSVNSNLQSAASVESEATAVSEASAAAAAPTSNTSSALAGSVGVTGSGTTTAQAAVTKSTSAPAACSGVTTSTSALSAQIACATASDSNLPSFVNNPGFASNFQKATGTSLGSFMASNDSPSSALASAMGGGLSPSQSATLAAAIKQMDNKLNPDVEGSTYAGGGGLNGGAEASNNPDLSAVGDAVSSLLKQLNPDGTSKDPQGAKSGISAVVFANRNRTPAAVTQDSSLSIFDRVTYRYIFVGRRVLTEGN
jgi:hypothetical protein